MAQAGLTDEKRRLIEESERYREAMTAEPVCLSSNTTLIDAAAQMREYDIGDVLITEQDRILGVLTDRDIVVRGLAGGKDPQHGQRELVEFHNLPHSPTLDQARQKGPTIAYSILQVKKPFQILHPIGFADENTWFTPESQWAFEKLWKLQREL